MGENTVDPKNITGQFTSFPYQDDLVDARKLVSPPTRGGSVSSEAQKNVIADVIGKHRPIDSRDGEDGLCSCGWQEGVRWGPPTCAEHLAEEIDKALGGEPASKEAAMTLALIDIAYTLREIRQILIDR